MSASQGPALSAIAFQLAASLEAYEHGVTKLVAAPADLELYQEVSSQVNRMRLYAAALPALAGAWVEVLIRHFELTHGIWRLQKGDPLAADLADLHARLQAAVRRLSGQALRLLPSA